MDRGAGPCRRRTRSGTSSEAICLFPLVVALALAPSLARGTEIPRRSASAATGTAFIARISPLGRDERERAILAELLAGNLPSHLRRLAEVRFEAVDGKGARRSVRLRAMPDYLAIGSDSDSVRMPMQPETAQPFCDAFGLALPTPKLVNEIWRRAAVRVWPQPLVEAREAPATFLRHSRIVDAQLAGRSGLAAGMKKDVVLTARLQASPGRVAIFGWHKPTGEPIQPLSLVHGSRYVDYSHGARPLNGQIAIDGRVVLYEDALRDPVLAPLLSDEGPLAEPRYPALERH